MRFMTLDLQAPYSLEYLPQDSTDVDATPLTVGWTVKTSFYALPYDVSDLAVTPGEPDPVVLNPPVGPAPAPVDSVGIPAPSTPGGGPAVPAPVPAAVRPGVAPRIRVATRVNPVLLRKNGLRVRVTVTEPAQVKLQVQARVKKKLSRRRTTTVTRKLTRQRTYALKRGTTTLRLPLGSAGRATIGRTTRLMASVQAITRYADARRITSQVSVRIAPNPVRKRTR
jgi:hypothetical protein